MSEPLAYFKLYVEDNEFTVFYRVNEGDTKRRIDLELDPRGFMVNLGDRIATEPLVK